MSNKPKFFRILCAILILIQSLQVMAYSVPVGKQDITSNAILVGDVNGDETVNRADLEVLSAHVAKIERIVDETLLANADINGDGEISAADMTALSAMLEEASDGFSITQVSVDRETGDAGSIFEWSVETEGGTGEIEYAFELLDCGVQLLSSEKNIVVAEQEYDTINSFCASIMDVGTYALSVTCRDEAGNTCTLAKQAPVTVTVPALDITAVRLQNPGSVFVGDTLEWTVDTVGGVLPVQYQYVLFINGDQVDAQSSAQDTYAFTATQHGEHLLQVTCIDAEGAEIMDYGESISVYKVHTGETPSGAPVLTLMDNTYVLSETEESAMEIPSDALRLQWEPVEYAEHYGLEVEKQTATGWLSIAGADVTQCNYTIDQDLLNALPAGTLCRVTAWSQGGSSSDEMSYYFKVKASSVGEEEEVSELTIDGETALTWTVASADIATRTFTVYPKAGWEVSSNVDWVSLLPNGNEFWAVLQENSGDTRTGTITVTYGEQTAIINVTQGSAAEPPALVYPEYSQDPDAPTEIPVGGMIMNYDNNKAPYVGFKLYEVTANGLKEVCNKVEVVKKKWVQVAPDELKANTDYILELSGYETENGDNEDDVLSSRYYLRMVEGGHILSLEGTDSVHKSTLDNFDVKLYCNGGWTWEADVDWLRPEAFLSMVFYANYQKIGIELDPNYTEIERTGTITFRYGNQSATLTVTQDSWLPRFIVPANLSENMNNPTILPGDRVLEDYVCKNSSYARFENGAWSEDAIKSSTSDRICRNVAYKDEQHYDTGVLYRFTLKSGEYTKVYYVKYDMGEKSPYALLRTTNGSERTELSLEMPAAKSEQELRLYTSGKWQIKSNCSWLSVSSANGETAASYKKIMVYADENLTGTERVGELTVYSEETACAQIRVTQTAKDYFLLLLENAGGDDIACDTNQYFYKIDGAGDSIPVEAWTNASLNVSSNVSWITYSSKKVRIEENTSGAERTGSVTFTCGNATPITVDFTQVTALQTPVVSPVLSTSSKNPSVRAYEDMHITWEAVEGAVKYTVYVMPGDYDLAIDGFHSYEKEIPATDAVAYNCTIPSSAFSLNCDDYDKLKVVAVDQWGYASGRYYYFINSSTECVRLNGTTTPIWENATDIATSQDFAVRATGPWTASANSNWISLNKTSGTESDILTVSLVANTGDARTGEVHVKTGNSTTVLTVNQCAYLPEFPTIKSPAFSDDVGSPTVIGDTTSLHVTWDYAPQVEYYEVMLLSHKDKSVWHPEKKSPELKTDEYTFENLELVPGLCYQIQLIRKSHWGPTGHCIYFTVSDENAFVLVDERELEECWYESTEDYEYFKITSSGTWTATVSDNWLLADNEKIGQEKLDELEAQPEYYSSFYGKNGDRLCITALANPTDAYRYGTVTVQCGGAMAEIQIAQPPYYEIATLQSPQLWNDKKEPTVLPYGPVTLRWSSAVGGTGTYRVSLYEREEGSVYRYDKIFEKDNISSTKYTLPMDLLTEGQYYGICLVTNVPGGYGGGCWYYFRMGYENELTVSTDVDWSNGSVTIHASASGGAGSYLYAYELLKDGSQVDITELGKWDSYGFSITQVGTYQVRVYVRDSADMTANVLSGTHTVGASDLVQLSLSQTQWEIAASGGTTTVSVETDGSWMISDRPDWITASSYSGSTGTTITLTAAAQTSGERSSKVVFTNNNKSVTLYVTQNGAALSKPTVTAPNEGASADLQDLSVKWNAVSGAGYYIFRVRDLTTDELVAYDVDLTTTSTVLSKEHLVSGHNYRIAIGAAHSGDSPTSGSVVWSERLFSVKAASASTSTVSGTVISAEGNPLKDAEITVYNASTNTRVGVFQTDSDGYWQVSGLIRNAAYTCEVYLPGYEFTPAEKSVTPTTATVTGIDFVAENSHEDEVEVTFGADRTYADFASAGGSDAFYITAPMGWIAEENSDWFDLSAYSGDSSGSVKLTVTENKGTSFRYDTITFRPAISLFADGNSAEFSMDIIQDPWTGRIHTVGSAAEKITDSSGRYNGAALIPGTTYGLATKDLVVSQNMCIPTSASIEVEGDIYIGATVELADTGWLIAHGSIYVMTGGRIDLSNGGNIAAGKDFVFQSSFDHTNYLTSGKIYVGRDVEITRNFYASGTNELHLVKEAVTHELDIEATGDQHVNHLIVDSQGIDSLWIKKPFDFEGELRLSNNGLLQGVRQSGNVYGIHPDQKHESAFRSEPRRNEILANVHVGLLRAMTERGRLTVSPCTCQTTGTYRYIDGSNIVRSYSVTVDYWGVLAGESKQSSGSIEYIEQYNGKTLSYRFYISGDPAKFVGSATEFKRATNQSSVDAYRDLQVSYYNVYRDALQSMVADNFESGTNIMKNGRTSTESMQLIAMLYRNNREQVLCCEAMRILSDDDSFVQYLGQPTLELRLDGQVLQNGSTLSASYKAGDTVNLEVKPSETDHLYRSWQGDTNQNKIWSSTEIVNGDWNSVAVTIPQGLPTGIYKIQVDASNDSVYNSSIAKKAVASVSVKILATYNPEAALEYALKYNGKHPGSDYNDSKYSKYTGNDCANFVSQCLVAGGLTTNHIWKPGLGSNAWNICRKGSNGNGLMEYLKSLGYKVYGYDDFSISRTDPSQTYAIDIDKIKPGDVIFSWGYVDDIPTHISGHAMIVDHVGSNGRVFYYGHTYDRCGCSTCGNTIDISSIHTHVAMNEMVADQAEAQAINSLALNNSADYGIDTRNHDEVVSLFSANVGNTSLVLVSDFIKVGDTVQLQFKTNGMNVSSSATGIHFDPERLEVVSVDSNPMVTTDGAEWEPLVVSSADQANASGRIGFAYANSQERTYVAGDLAEITFEVIGEGTTTFTLYEDSDGTDGIRSDNIQTLNLKIGASSSESVQCEFSLTDSTETSASVSLVNTGSSGFSASFVVAVYDKDSKMLNAKSVESVFAPEDTAELTVDFGAQEAVTVKAFLLDAITYEPLASCWESSLE